MSKSPSILHKVLDTIKEATQRKPEPKSPSACLPQSCLQGAATPGCCRTRLVSFNVHHIGLIHQGSPRGRSMSRLPIQEKDRVQETKCHSTRDCLTGFPPLTIGVIRLIGERLAGGIRQQAALQLGQWKPAEDSFFRGSKH